jgi:Xaa-Pro aminopeptidase
VTHEALSNVRTLLSEKNLDAALISSPTNRRYLSGYSADDHAPDESAGVLLIGRDSAHLFTSAVNADWAAAEAPDFVVESWKRPWEKFISEQITQRDWRRIGFEDRGVVVSSREALGTVSDTVMWIALGESVDALRAQKSDAEIDELAKAIRQTDEVFEEIARTIAPGETEAQVGWKIERLTREMAGGTVAFSPIVASGPNSARPHHAVSDRVIQPGEPIVIDMGVASNGYRGDLTRTIWLGEPSAKLQEVYNAVRRAQAAVLDVIKPSVSVREVDQLARDEISKAGFENYIVHAVGHGLGLRVHEAPSVSINSDEILRTGHVVTVEPGVYIPDWGGVRIEDVVVVTDDGNRNFTAARKHGDLEI